MVVIVPFMSTAASADYAQALRAHMLGSATDEQRALLESVRVAAGYPAGRYPLPPADAEAPVRTGPDGLAGTEPTGPVEPTTPRRRRYDVPLADEIADCGQWPSRPVRDR